MAQNGRVLPNCVNASNPFHECTESCLKKIKETKPQKNKKSSDYRRSVTDGELGKKINEDKRILTGCPKASNPYHECDENCYKRIAEADSGAIPIKFGRKKKLGSKPEPPVLDSIPASKIGARNLSDAPISHHSEEKKVELNSKEHISREPVSGAILSQEFMPVYHKDQSKDGVERLANPIPSRQEDKNASHKAVPIAPVNDTEDLATLACGSMDFGFSGIPRSNEDSDEEETESVVSESRVPVGRYNVKEIFAPILRSIFDKYGDIGANCHLESVVMRSYYIECVCFVVQELQSTSIMRLTKSKVKELSAILKDVESAQLNVAWLRSILNKMAKNIELINQHRAVEVAKANSDREVESLREELQSDLETLAQKEQDISVIETRIAETRDRLRELEIKSSELDKSISSIKSKVDNLDSKSLLDELL